MKDDADRDRRIETFIRSNLPLMPVPSIPEIRLHKAVPASRIGQLSEWDEDFCSPYWAHHWGGGLALARHILERPECVAGRSLLDLGSGSGIVGIAAARAGAHPVTAADIDPYARVATSLNAAANEVEIQLLSGDPLAVPPPDVAIVAVGDLFYDPRLAARVTAWLDICLVRGIEVLIGDPWRSGLPRGRLGKIAEYDVCEYGADARPAAVFSFLPEPFVGSSSGQG